MVVAILSLAPTGMALRGQLVTVVVEIDAPRTPSDTGPASCRPPVPHGGGDGGSSVVVIRPLRRPHVLLPGAPHQGFRACAPQQVLMVNC